MFSEEIIKRFELAERRVAKFNLDEIRNFLQFCRTNKIEWEDIARHVSISQLCKAINRNIKTASPKSIFDLIQLFDSLGVTWQELNEQGLANPLLRKLDASLAKLLVEELIRTYLFCARLGVPRENTELYAYIENKIERYPNLLKNKISANRYFQAQFYLYPLPDKSSFKNQKSESNQSRGSTLQEVVVQQIVNKLGCYGIEEEVSIGPFEVDILLANKIVIEINGPHHYTATGRLRFHDVRRTELLRQMGYKVFHIDYRDWNTDDKRTIDKLKAECLKIVGPIRLLKKPVLFLRQSEQISQLFPGEVEKVRSGSGAKVGLSEGQKEMDTALAGSTSRLDVNAPEFVPSKLDVNAPEFVPSKLDVNASEFVPSKLDVNASGFVPSRLRY